MKTLSPAIINTIIWAPLIILLVRGLVVPLVAASASGTYAIGVWAAGQHTYGIFTSQPLSSYMKSAKGGAQCVVVEALPCKCY